MIITFLICTPHSPWTPRKRKYTLPFTISHVEQSIFNQPPLAFSLKATLIHFKKSYPPLQPKWFKSLKTTLPFWIFSKPTKIVVAQCVVQFSLGQQQYPVNLVLRLVSFVKCLSGKQNSKSLTDRSSHHVKLSSPSCLLAFKNFSLPFCFRLLSIYSEDIQRN